MSIGLTPDEVEEVQERYRYLINYSAEDPTAPIDPLAYTDSNGDQLLHIAAQSGDLRTVELLVRAGVDVNKPGDMGCTALHYARQKSHALVAEFLLAHGASAKIRNSFGHLPGEQ